jgi:hypothetical protein
VGFGRHRSFRRRISGLPTGDPLTGGSGRAVAWADGSEPQNGRSQDTSGLTAF